MPASRKGLQVLASAGPRPGFPRPGQTDSSTHSYSRAQPANTSPDSARLGPGFHSQDAGSASGVGDPARVAAHTRGPGEKTPQAPMKQMRGDGPP